ncbi:MAG: formate dehydrogenase accessory sulfurtransferase FdhD, partial [Acidimicrobiales bacterium]
MTLHDQRPGRVATTGRAGPVEAVQVHALSGDSFSERPDQVVGEEPLEIRMTARGQAPTPVAVTMRTPGNDFELAVGFLLSEGLLESAADVVTVRYCDLPSGDPQRFNVVTVTGITVPEAAARRRTGTVTASCGVCGTATLDDLRDRCPAVPRGHQVDARTLTGLPSRLREHQRVFERT